MNRTQCIVTMPGSIAASVRRAKEIIESDIRKHMPICDLAKASHTNTFTLKRFFKIMYHTSIYQHLLGERMRHANDLLSKSALLEKEIARLCGFKRLSGFVSSYKKYYGKTPGQFRLEHLRKKSS